MGILSLLSRRARPAPRVNLASPHFKADPFSFYAALRDDTPVCRTLLPTRERAWLITRYDDAGAVLKDERFAKAPGNALTPAHLARRPWFRRRFQSLQRQMLTTDAPDHARLRALVSQAFTPRLIEQMRDRVQRLTDDLLDALQDRGHCDLIR